MGCVRSDNIPRSRDGQLLPVSWEAGSSLPAAMLRGSQELMKMAMGRGTELTPNSHHHDELPGNGSIELLHLLPYGAELILPL